MEFQGDIQQERTLLESIASKLALLLQCQRGDVNFGVRIPGCAFSTNVFSLRRHADGRLAGEIRLPPIQSMAPLFRNIPFGFRRSESAFEVTLFNETTLVSSPDDSRLASALETAASRVKTELIRFIIGESR